MGVAQYQLSAALPDRLKLDLPTAEDLQREPQSMAATELRIEIEYSLRDFASAYDIPARRTKDLGSLLRALQQRGKAPPSAERFLEAWGIMQTADAFDVDSPAATDAMRVSRQFLSELTGSPLGTHA